VNALAVLGRTLADTADPASWGTAHEKVIGSYQAGAFAKRTSVETYIRQMLTPRSFSGNAATESGNRWEPLLLAFAGAEPNSLLIHHPDEKQYGATVDGTRGLSIIETKAKHLKVVTGPTPREVRQMAWQLFVLPEYEAVDFTWGELVRDEREPDGWRLRRDPQTITFPRDHPTITAAIDLIVPIAGDVLAGLRAARALTNGVPF
jgi:hypothetical protein